MASGSASRHPDLAKLAEKQLRNWEIARSQRPAQPAPRPIEVEDFVACSLAVGAGGAAGAQIAGRLGARLNWPMFDKEILQAMADDDPTRERIYHSLDERDLSWLEESLGSLAQSSFKKNDYFHRLTTTVLALALQGPAVFRGRAADLILPQDRGFRVRLTASRQSCIDGYAQQQDLDPTRAGEEVERIESERADFVQRHFGVAAAEQSRHDLIVNLDRFTADQAVDLILAAREMRSLGG